MAKFAKWNGWLDMARDLRRGLYQLTFKDNMPNEPVEQDWSPDIRSTDGTTFQIDASAGAKCSYYILGNRCFFRISGLKLNISGNPQTVFWIKLPAPGRFIGKSRWSGWMFTPYPNAIFVNGLIYPNEWWLRIEAHSQVARVGSFPIGDGQSLYMEGDYEIHPTFIATGALQERDVPFESYAISVWTSFIPVITPGAGTISFNNVHVNYYEVNDSVTMFVSGTFNLLTAPTNTIVLTMLTSVPWGYAGVVMEAGPIGAHEILIGNFEPGAGIGDPATLTITLPVGNFTVNALPFNGLTATFIYKVL